jgi:hypothetical protein
MAAVINSTTTGSVGIIVSGGADNQLNIQTADTTAIAIDASQNVAITGDLSFNNGQAAVGAGKAIALSMIFG